jgi:hypothetical protein
MYDTSCREKAPFTLYVEVLDEELKEVDASLAADLASSADAEAGLHASFSSGGSSGGASPAGPQFWSPEQNGVAALGLGVPMAVRRSVDGGAGAPLYRDSARSMAEAGAGLAGLGVEPQRSSGNLLLDADAPTGGQPLPWFGAHAGHPDSGGAQSSGGGGNVGCGVHHARSASQETTTSSVAAAALAAVRGSSAGAGGGPAAAGAAADGDGGGSEDAASTSSAAGGRPSPEGSPSAAAPLHGGDSGSDPAAAPQQQGSMQRRGGTVGTEGELSEAGSGVRGSEDGGTPSGWSSPTLAADLSLTDIAVDQVRSLVPPGSLVGPVQSCSLVRSVVRSPGVLFRVALVCGNGLLHFCMPAMSFGGAQLALQVNFACVGLEELVSRSNLGFSKLVRDPLDEVQRARKWELSLRCFA